MKEGDELFVVDTSHPEKFKVTTEMSNVMQSMGETRTTPAGEAITCSVHRWYTVHVLIPDRACLANMAAKLLSEQQFKITLNFYLAN